MSSQWSPADHRAQAEARVGSVIKQKWRIDQLIGLGGMSAVYAATHRTGHKVAIKVLHAALAPIAEVRARFRQEPYLANRVTHEGITRVLDDDVAEDGVPFVVMELLDGETLDELARRSGGRLPTEESLWIADRLLDILVASHAVGVLHRDVKPQNVVVTRGGAIKLLDFGIARFSGGSSTMTQIGGVIGSPAFMPPEQARGQWDGVDERSDIWAVGATMFTLLTGHFVHEGATAMDLLAAAMRPARSIASLAPALPSLVVQVIDRALAFDPSIRWPSAAAMQAALADAQATWDEPTATIDPSGALQSRVAASGTVLLRDSFPDWSVSSLPPVSSARAVPVGGGTQILDGPPSFTPSGAMLAGAGTQILDIPSPPASAGTAPHGSGTQILEPPPTPKRAAGGLWYVSDGVRVVGPVTADLLRRGIEAGKVPDDSVVRHESWSDWRTIEEALEALSPE